jgi:hypothetical protein
MTEQEEALEILEALSDGELLGLAENSGDRSLHRGMGRAKLEAAVANIIIEGTPGSGPGPFDKHRAEVMDFLRREAGRIQIQCHGDCFQHSDARVAQCWLRIQRKVK